MSKRPKKEATAGIQRRLRRLFLFFSNCAIRIRSGRLGGIEVADAAANASLFFSLMLPGSAVGCRLCLPFLCCSSFGCVCSPRGFQNCHHLLCAAAAEATEAALSSALCQSEEGDDNTIRSIVCVVLGRSIGLGLAFVAVNLSNVAGVDGRVVIMEVGGANPATVTAARPSCLYNSSRSSSRKPMSFEGNGAAFNNGGGGIWLLLLIICETAQ